MSAEPPYQGAGGNTASVLLPNGHRKREFEICCYCGNPILRATFVALARLFRKRGKTGRGKFPSRAKKKKKVVFDRRLVKPNVSRMKFDDLVHLTADVTLGSIAVMEIRFGTSQNVFNSFTLADCKQL